MAVSAAGATVHFCRILLLKTHTSSSQSPAALMRMRLPIGSPLSPPQTHSTLFLRARRPYRISVKEESGGSSETLDEATSDNPDASDEPAASSVAEELKQMMEARRKEESSSPVLLTGVAEEVREIEWPAFDKVLGTTGIVLAVIVGSSVALLTINAVLAELSDKIFAGRGIQDFF